MRSSPSDIVHYAPLAAVRSRPRLQQTGFYFAVSFAVETAVTTAVGTAVGVCQLILEDCRWRLAVG